MVNTLQKQIAAKQKEKEEVTQEYNNYIYYVQYNYLYVLIIRVILYIGIFGRVNVWKIAKVKIDGEKSLANG